MAGPEYTGQANRSLVNNNYKDSQNGSLETLHKAYQVSNDTWNQT